MSLRRAGRACAVWAGVLAGVVATCAWVSASLAQSDAAPSPEPNPKITPESQPWDEPPVGDLTVPGPDELVMPPPLDGPDAGADGDAAPSGPLGLPSLSDLVSRMEPGPDAPVERRLAWLFAELKAAPDAEEAAFVAEEIEALWSDVGDPTAVLLTQRARAASLIGEDVLARRLVNGAVRLAPDSADAWVTSAALALNDDDIARAITDLEQALQLEPRRYDALLTLAALFEGLENWRGAYDSYEDVLAIYPQMPFAQDRLRELESRARGRAL